MSTRYWRNLAALSTVAIVAGMIAFVVERPSANQRRKPTAIRVEGIDLALERADVPVATLADYYEHGVEHAPPRDPSGCMQRRERCYTAPKDPFVSLRSCSVGQGSTEGNLENWEREWRAGRNLSVPESVLDAAAASNVNANNLFDVGRAFAFLSGSDDATSWYRVAMVKAMKEYAGVCAGDPRARPLLNALAQTKALWQVHDYQTMEMRFRLAARLQPALSPEARRAGYLLGEMLFYQNHYAEAADVILSVQADHLRAGDLGVLEKGDIAEMNYMLGLFQFKAGRFAQAIPYLRAAIAGPDDRERETSMRCLIETFASLDRAEDAENAFRQWQQAFPAKAANEPVTTFMASIAAARSRAQHTD